MRIKCPDFLWQVSHDVFQEFSRSSPSPLPMILLAITDGLIETVEGQIQESERRIAKIDEMIARRGWNS